jgi:predicted transcriptional regulator
MNKMTIHVGGARDMGQRFADAFNRAAAGETVSERHITFLSLEEMMSALTPKRLELLRYLRRNEATNIRKLAQALHRDYRRVHEDVKTLEASGIIAREEGRIVAPWAVLTAEVDL